MDQVELTVLEEISMDGLPRPTNLTIEPDEVLSDISAHEYLIGVYRGQIKPNGSRLRAAIASLPFEKPKLAVVASVGQQDMAEALAKALEQSQQVVQARLPTRFPTYETRGDHGSKAEVAAGEVAPGQVSAEHMRQPMTSLDTNRWRRF